MHENILLYRQTAGIILNMNSNHFVENFIRKYLTAFLNLLLFRLANTRSKNLQKHDGTKLQATNVLEMFTRQAVLIKSSLSNDKLLRCVKSLAIVSG
jgi:hypothetical protein